MFLNHGLINIWLCRLRRECRALLTVLSRYVRLKVFKSEVLKDVVRESLLEIELNIFKGKALYLSISYLNNLPLFK